MKVNGVKEFQCLWTFYTSKRVEKMYKMILSDLDETLLVNHHVPELNQQAVKSLQNKDVKLIRMRQSGWSCRICSRMERKRFRNHPYFLSTSTTPMTAASSAQSSTPGHNACMPWPPSPLTSMPGIRRSRFFNSRAP